MSEARKRRTTREVLAGVIAGLPGDLREPPDLRYGPTEDDVHTALVRLHYAEQVDWSPAQAERLAATLKQLVRERRPPRRDPDARRGAHRSDGPSRSCSTPWANVSLTWH